MNRRLRLIVLGAGLCAGGCAFGKAEFRVLRSAPPAPTAVETPAPAAAEPAPEATGDSQAVYTVVRGDSLWKIAQRLWGDPWRYGELAQDNRLADPDRIEPGQKLNYRPAAATPPVRVPRQAQAAAGTAPRPPAKPAPAGMVFPQRENRAFRPGESLTFSVEYFGIAAGFATLAVENGPLMHGRPTLHLIATARTHPAFEWFFKVRDRIESYFDAQGLFSWQYEKHLREGSYSNDSVIVYDQLERRVIKDQGRTVVPAPAWTQDVLSEFYFFRTLNFEVGQTLAIPVVADDGKSYELIVTVLRREHISVPTGSYDCWVVEPTLKFEGLFQQKGKIQIWLTADERKVPVLIKSQIAIGTIDIVLRDAVVME